MDEEVEELDLGVGDLRERLPVDAHDLQERDQREPGVEHRAERAQQFDVVVADSASSDAAGNPAVAQMRRISSGSMPVSASGLVERCTAPSEAPGNRSSRYP